MLWNKEKENHCFRLFQAHIQGNISKQLHKFLWRITGFIRGLSLLKWTN
jgi:hypothetical protein